MATCTRDYNKDIDSTIISFSLPEDAPNFIKYESQGIIHSTSSAVSYRTGNLHTFVTPPEDKKVPFYLETDYVTRLNTVDYTYTYNTEDGTVVLTNYDSSILDKNIVLPSIEHNVG